MLNNLFKNNKGFTGLEAAIVLVAFVVVAAVFSYVMLGAGFYTTQKSQEVVHTGVAQASSSVELSGDIIAAG
ncbi:MAG TPA: flagellin, partial [Methanosarcina sp.]|nr:flagellin [Methanosarcina sp.]